MCKKFQRVIMVMGNDEFTGPLESGTHEPLNDGIAAGVSNKPLCPRP